MAAGPNTFGLPRIAYPNPAGSIPVSALLIADAPSVIGGNANGPAEEFHAGADFDILSRTGGAIAFNTRAALSLARLDQAQTFTGTQTANAGASLLAFIAYTADAGATGAVLRFNHDTPSPANNDSPGVFQFFGRDDGGNIVNWCGLTCQIVNVSAAAKSSRFIFSTTFGNVGMNSMILGGGLVVGGSVDPGSGYVSAVNAVKGGTFTVATLPAAATAGQGARANVNDALAPAYLVALAGGGAAFSGALSTGAAWVSS